MKDKNKKKEEVVEPARLDVISNTAEIEPQQKTQITQTGNPAKAYTTLPKVSIASFTNSGMRIG